MVLFSVVVADCRTDKDQPSLLRKLEKAFIHRKQPPVTCYPSGRSTVLCGPASEKRTYNTQTDTAVLNTAMK